MGVAVPRHFQPGLVVAARSHPQVPQIKQGIEVAAQSRFGTLVRPASSRSCWRTQPNVAGCYSMGPRVGFGAYRGDAEQDT
jgi:hypothetical protein